MFATKALNTPRYHGEFLRRVVATKRPPRHLDATRDKLADTKALALKMPISAAKGHV